MGIGAVVRALGLGLTLASALILMWGQPWDPSAMRDRWTAAIGFSSRPIVGEVYVWLNARVAGLLLIGGIALQLAGGGLGAPAAQPIVWWWSLGAVSGTAIAVATIWIASREPLITCRLVRLCLGSDMRDVSDIQLLWHLDQDRAHPLVSSSEVVEIEPVTGAPSGPDAKRLLEATRYGECRRFSDLRTTRRAEPLRSE